MADEILKEGTFITGTGQIVQHVHPRAICVGPHCVVHRPMHGPWDSWRTHWRPDNEMDRMFGLYRGFERICPHGVGHPAAEEVLRRGPIVHGCDGCPCGPADAWRG